MRPKLTSVVVWGVTLSLLSFFQSSGARDLFSSAQWEEKFSKAYDVTKRRAKDLMAHPDVFGVLPTKDGILIITDRPATIPTQLERVIS